MPRVKRGTISAKSRRNVLKKAKGYKFGRSKKEIQAKVAITKAGVHAFRDRRDKKNQFRRLWNIKIGAGLSEYGLSYSRFIDALKKKNVELDRKILADLAENEPAIFKEVVESVK